jgi:hypothetical protein
MPSGPSGMGSKGDLGGALDLPDWYLKAPPCGGAFSFPLSLLF